MTVEQCVKALQEEARNVAWPGESLERLPFVTRRSSIGGEMNMVTAFNLDQENAERIIQGEIGHFGWLGKSFEWKVFSFDTPNNLETRLAQAGFTVGDPEALVLYDLSAGVAALEFDLNCKVRRVERLEQLADFRSVAEEVFGKDYSLTCNQLADAISNGTKGHEGYIGYVDEVPASVGRLYTNPQSLFAGLYGGGTRAKYRGQGCYRAIIAARGRDAFSKGARFLQVDAMPTSLPILLKLGFVQVATTWPCTWPPEA